MRKAGTGGRVRKLWKIECVAIVLAVLLHIFLARYAVFMMFPDKASNKPEFIFLGPILPMTLTDNARYGDDKFPMGKAENIFFNNAVGSDISLAEHVEKNRYSDKKTADRDRSFLKTTFLSSGGGPADKGEDIARSLGRPPLPYKPLHMNIAP